MPVLFPGTSTIESGPPSQPQPSQGPQSASRRLYGEIVFYELKAGTPTAGVTTPAAGTPAAGGTPPLLIPPYTGGLRGENPDMPTAVIPTELEKGDSIIEQPLP